MRTKAIFSVFGRKLPSGKVVYYYQCYDPKGKRQWAKSTGITKKTEAVKYCQKLYRDGLLIPEQKVPTFAEFSAGWWEPDTCNYVKWRQLHEPLSPATLATHQGSFKHHIKDYFAKYRLDEITPEIVEGWLLHMSEKVDLHLKNGKSEKKLKPKTINLIYCTLKLMMNEAVRKKLIKVSPCADVKKLKADEIVRNILTVEEARKILSGDWSVVWENRTAYLANLLAACTGLRIGEVMGLKCEYVFDEYVHVGGQYTQYGYSEMTKTRHFRNVPIPSLVRQELEELMQANKGGFVFSEDGGATPIDGGKLRRQFERALNKIGISREERMKRNLSFHAWRHFLNTMLRNCNVADSKVQKVTGHLTQKMTDHYTHFDPRKFSEVRDAQTDFLTAKEPEKTETKQIENIKTEKQEGEEIKAVA